MKTVCEENECNGCMACVEICPKRCINIEDKIQFLNATIDEKKCVNCNKCKNVCPNINKVVKMNVKEWYQGWIKTNERRESSSGGIAAAIMKKVILDGGYVATCCWENQKFSFDLTNNIKDIKKFLGSKYVKSNPEGIFQKIKEKIMDNKILFIGLPCQVAALKNIIKNDENLYTVDLICHGTPSQLLLEKYLEEKNIDIKEIDRITFREKSNYGIKINEKNIDKLNVMDEYICAFLEGISFTENCYNCEYACSTRISDLTIGDSWGTELKDEIKNGVSLILVQNEKGKYLIEDDNIVLKKVDIKNAIDNNHQLSHPTKKSTKREKLFYLLDKGYSFKKTVKYVLPKRIVKQKIKGIIKKINNKMKENGEKI